MKRVVRIMVGIALGAMLASYFSSKDGQRAMSRVLHRATTLAQDRSPGIFSGETPGFSGPDGGALEAKIAETRRRLEDQLRAQLGREQSG